MNQRKPVLIVEDDADLRQALGETLELGRIDCVQTPDAESAIAALAETDFGLIISDVQMPGIDGYEFLEYVKSNYTETPIVLMTAFGDVPKAVAAIKAGAADYITKPFQAEVLIETIERFLPQSFQNHGMIIEDRKSKELARLASRVAQSDVTVMISGESGSGKEVYARYIHECSNRKSKPFCAINCAAIPESMLESILFGFEKGAFTGAYTSRAGKFEQANQSTLLLDEISEIELGLQAKLLRVIQEKEVERLGSNKTIPLDVRIIATTNRDLKEEVLAGRFREDLFFRLNVFPLSLPPLRERPDDIIPLAYRLIEAQFPGQGIELSDSAKDRLLNHSWRGNVRELENVVQRALIMKSGFFVRPEDIVFEEFTPESTGVQTAEADNLHLLETDLKTREQELIMDAIKNNGSRKEAAEKLGISPRTLRYKLAQFREQGVAVPPVSSIVSAS
ncbi:MAG: sigma-54 dependent transcriptional regulator [Pseudomonadales bacterium]|nr:sigma-54 dependent transcriptional regulator [Pseudomonadales bacterium]